MSLKAGIVGLPNVGKSTLFNAVTNSQVEAANYPFATIEPNSGIVELPDARIDNLAKIVSPEKIIKSTFEFIDIAGLVEGASTGEGLGNKFLSNIREVDAIVEVVRCFEDEDITHVSGNIDPLRDISIIDTELLLADIETINNIYNKVSKKALATKDKDLMQQYNLSSKIKESLEKEIPIRRIELDDNEKKLAKMWNLLTIKPIIYVGNVSEEFVGNPEESEIYKNLYNSLKKDGQRVIGISAKIEGEISQIDDMDEKQLFLDEMNIKESGLNKLTRAAFDTLDLATYFTAGKKEVRSWTFKKGMTAPQCAGIIHTDFERGFIKADVISYDDFIETGGEVQARQAGKNRLEGKNYIFQDGDVAEFKFNV